jgi:hypothetical protein
VLFCVGGDYEMNIQSKGERLEKAQEVRYSKINHLIQYLQGTNTAWLIDELVEDSRQTAFCVGKRIRVDGKIIKIGKREKDCDFTVSNSFISVAPKTFITN